MHGVYQRNNNGTVLELVVRATAIEAQAWYEGYVFGTASECWTQTERLVKNGCELTDGELTIQVWWGERQ